MGQEAGAGWQGPLDVGEETGLQPEGEWVGQVTWGRTEGQETLRSIVARVKEGTARNCMRGCTLLQICEARRLGISPGKPEPLGALRGTAKVDPQEMRAADSPRGRWQMAGRMLL